MFDCGGVALSEDRLNLDRESDRSDLGRIAGPVCFWISPLSSPGASSVVVDLVSYGLHKIVIGGTRKGIAEIVQRKKARLISKPDMESKYPIITAREF